MAKGMLEEEAASASDTIDISIIIPCYNEERRLPLTLERIAAFFQNRTERVEIIVVDDGSTDGTATSTSNIKGPGSIKLLRNETNTGKGFAVRTGIMAASGDTMLICDADLSTPIEEIENFCSAMRKGYDVVIASRKHDASVLLIRQPWHREIMGKIYNLLVQAFIIKGYKDTQCGFKLFRGNVAKLLFSKARINGFSFDAEILCIARMNGFRITELPVRWVDSRDSRVRIISDAVKMIAELLVIRNNGRRGVYL